MQKCIFCILDGQGTNLDNLERTSTHRRESLRAYVTGGRGSSYVYRVHDGLGNGPHVLQQVCKERGWKEFGEKEPSTSLAKTNYQQKSTSTTQVQSWNLWWKNSTMNWNRIRLLKPDQITNHIPKASFYCRKDVLARHLRRLKSTYGSVYDFSPLSFNLPLEYTRLVAEHTKRVDEVEYGKPPDASCIPFGPNHHFQRGKKVPIWISKPVSKSQGRGIILFDQVTKFSYHEPCVVQEYIARPYLINGHKWDLRLYVCVTKTSPLTVYAYREGITRFATNKYDLSNLLNYYSHLTNTYVNKQSPTYKKNKDIIGVGSKWTLGRLRNYFQSIAVNDFYMWQRIWSILVLTIIGDARNISKLEVSENCFEFLGFDVLVDENLKPHLLEVNTNPGLSCDTCVDEIVKKPMLHQLFSLLGLPDVRQFQRKISPTEEVQASKLYFKHIASQLTSKDDVNTGAKWTTKRVCESILTSKKLVQYQDMRKMRGCQFLNWSPTGRFHSIGLGVCALQNHDARQLLAAQELITAESAKTNENKANEHLNEDGTMVSEITNPWTYQRALSSQKFFTDQQNSRAIRRNSANWSVSDLYFGSPVSCGDWVKIFPFNKVTDEISHKKPISDDHLKEAIAEVSDYLRFVKDLFRDSSCDEQDEHYDSLIVKNKGISHVWHPPINENK